MADFDTTQQKKFAEPVRITVSREAFNELKAIAANIPLRRAEAAAREAQKRAEAKAIQAEAAAREAQKKAEAKAIQAEAAAREAQKKAEAKAIQAEAAAREANYIPFLTTTQWLGVAGLAVSLRALLTPGY